MTLEQNNRDLVLEDGDIKTLSALDGQKQILRNAMQLQRGEIADEPLRGVDWFGILSSLYSRAGIRDEIKRVSFQFDFVTKVHGVALQLDDGKLKVDLSLNIEGESVTI